jgi:hypothetical protein
VGASWLADAPDAARELNALDLPGVRFGTTRRTVRVGEKFGGRSIPMLDVVVTDRDRLDPIVVGAHLLRVVQRRHPERVRYQARGMEELAGSRAFREALTAGAPRRSRARAWMRCCAPGSTRRRRSSARPGRTGSTHPDPRRRRPTPRATRHGDQPAPRHSGASGPALGAGSAAGR